MIDWLIIGIQVGVIVMLVWDTRLNRLAFRELDRRQEFSELRLLAIETALREHGIVVQDTPDE